MSTHSVIELWKVRDVGDVLNVTFEFIRQNYKTLGKSLLFIVGPVTALTMAGVTMMIFGIGTLDSTNAADGVLSVGLLGMGFLLLMTFGIILQVLPSLVVNAFGVLYQDHGPGVVEVADVWHLSKRRFWAFLGALILIGIMGVVIGAISIIPCLGAIVYLIGSFYIAVTFSLVYPMLMRERIGVFDALSRCVKLVKSSWWATCGVVFLANFIYIMAIGICFVPLLLASTVADFNDLDFFESGYFQVVLVLVGVVGLLVFVLLRAVPELAVMFQYFNLVERKERPGLMAQIDAIDPSDAPDTLSPDNPFDP